MALEELGGSPTDLMEYLCAECGAEFEMRATDWKEREDFMIPKFCPMCGVASALP